MSKDLDLFAGLYRGVVVSTTDPKQQYRISLKVPTVFGDEVVENVPPCLPNIHTPLPHAGTTVWVMFEACNARMPVWLGVLKPV